MNVEDFEDIIEVYMKENLLNYYLIKSYDGGIEYLYNFAMRLEYLYNGSYLENWEDVIEYMKKNLLNNDEFEKILKESEEQHKLLYKYAIRYFMNK